MPQARKATPYPRFERREGERDRERGRGGRDTGGGAHGDASGGTHGGGGGGACGGGGGSACGGERAAACMEVGAAARAEAADWRCARADWWRARAVETKYGERERESALAPRSVHRECILGYWAGISGPFFSQ
jgi:hypothetical protein